MRKEESEEERKTSSKFYRDKTIDKELYEWLSELVGNFTTKEKLDEVGHGMDTNINESLNSIVAWIAPKSKSYSGTISLKTRIFIAIGIHLAGFESFFLKLYESMAIEVTPGIAYYLKMQQKGRDRRLVKAKDTETKKRRRRKQYQQLKDATERLRRSRAKQMGEYAPGIQCQPATVVVEEDTTIRVCSACKEVGHLRPWSKSCRFYVPRKKKTGLEVAESNCPSKDKVLVKDLEEDGNEQGMMDSISFDLTGELTAGHLNSVLDDN